MDAIEYIIYVFAVFGAGFFLYSFMYFMKTTKKNPFDKKDVEIYDSLGHKIDTMPEVNKVNPSIITDTTLLLRKENNVQYTPRVVESLSQPPSIPVSSSISSIQSPSPEYLVYCLRCKTKIKPLNPEPKDTGRALYVKGICPVCSKMVSGFTKKHE